MSDRSRSPRRSESYRSRDQDRDRDRDREDRPRPKKKNLGGFSYKDKRRDDNYRDDRDRDSDRRGGSYRGYRDRSRSPRRRDRDRDDDRGPTSSSSGTTKKSGKSKSLADKEDTSKAPSRAPAAAAGPTPEFIVVHVNDRLGTKAAIPCLPTDTIKDFKIIVASRIGREPHEIMLKRQGQRPFKDMITLADYEISNGVQLDLEVDTGD